MNILVIVSLGTILGVEIVFIGFSVLGWKPALGKGLIFAGFALFILLGVLMKLHDYYVMMGLPIGVSDMDRGSYQLLSYVDGETVNVFLMGANKTGNPHTVWGVAVPKRQWMVKDHPTVVYISEVAINGKSEVIVTDKPPTLP